MTVGQADSRKDMQMTKNMGQLDRGLRFAVGVALLLATFAFGIGTGWLHWVMAAVGAVMLVTALVGNCPAYSLVGIKTCRT
jgi:VIT1/CCC1 family predicted Fe2+/Mn2+ transporter